MLLFIYPPTSSRTEVSSAAVCGNVAQNEFRHWSSDSSEVVLLDCPVGISTITQKDIGEGHMLLIPTWEALSGVSL